MNINPKKTANEKVTLMLSGTTIHSLSELREHFHMDDALTALMNGTLEQWLTQHYYEQEAAQLSGLTIDTPDCRQKLCTILGIDYQACVELSEEEKAALLQRKELLRQYTDDESVLNKANQVALNQEELARLLDAGITLIYLCHFEFSIPISKAGVHYIGVDHPHIEHAFTKEQYRKAGILVEQIALPEEENPHTKEYADRAARKHGYDFFSDTHSPLSSFFHRELKAVKLSRYYRLPFNNTATLETYHTKSECERARNACLEKAYDAANRYVSPGDSKNIAKDAATHYSDVIQQCFTPVIDHLKLLCHMTNHDTVFDQLSSLVKNSRKNLLALFEAELQDSSDYYRMYHFDYFLDQVDIEKHDYRVSDEGFFRLLETALCDHVEYSYKNAALAVNEMENDINDHAASFFNYAYTEYEHYTGEIEELIDSISKDLPTPEEEEDLAAYLTRICVKLV
ncbi:MAG: hypothetical protein PUB10_02755 [Clostridiales bacterium]|nr:hypothetical protein [Clostridiales bacterium]